MNKRILVLLLVMALFCGCMTACKPKSDIKFDIPADTDQKVENEDDREPEKEEESEDQEPEEEDEPEDQEPEKEENKKPEKEDEKEEEPKKEETPKEENKEENSEEDYSDLFQEDEKDYSNHTVFASYNVKCMRYGKKEEFEGIAKELKDLNVSVVGLQEVDNMNARSGNEDQLKRLAELAGFEYYAFTPAVNENYGTAIMSKFPIKEHKVHKYQHQYKEDRSYSRSVIDLNGKDIVFYNTHLELDLENHKAHKIQFEELITAARKDKFVVITGDFNGTPKSFSDYYTTDEFMPLNGGDTFTFTTPTQPSGKNPTSAIDNIIVSTDWDYYLEEDTQIGVRVSYTDWSDHNMVYTWLKVPDKKKK